MEPAPRPIASVLIVLLVVLAGCSLPVVDDGGTDPGAAAASTTAQPSTSTLTGTADGTRAPAAEETSGPGADPMTTPTATPTAEPTPTVESPTGIRVVEINADAETVDDEYVVLKNTADRPLDMSGWRVKDEDGHVYTFPDGYSLGVDETVTLHSGRGVQTASDRFWWLDEQVWDASGDTVAIFDDRGHKIYERSFS